MQELTDIVLKEPINQSLDLHEVSNTLTNAICTYSPIEPEPQITGYWSMIKATLQAIKHDVLKEQIEIPYKTFIGEKDALEVDNTFVDAPEKEGFRKSFSNLKHDIELQRLKITCYAMELENEPISVEIYESNIREDFFFGYDSMKISSPSNYLDFIKEHKDLGGLFEKDAQLNAEELIKAIRNLLFDKVLETVITTPDAKSKLTDFLSRYRIHGQYNHYVEKNLFSEEDWSEATIETLHMRGWEFDESTARPTLGGGVTGEWKPKSPRKFKRGKRITPNMMKKRHNDAKRLERKYGDSVRTKITPEIQGKAQEAIE